jgi:hypothetical protein
MLAQDTAARREQAAAEANSQLNRADGLRLVNSLTYGLTTLRNSLFTRVHEDVQKYVGRDSMVMPVSLLESEETTKVEIEIFQLAVSTIEFAERGYGTDHSWYAMWLGALRLDDCQPGSASYERLSEYLKMSARDRRAAFMRVLEKTFPEAARSPLVLHRLFPPAAGIVTAQAFQDHDAALGHRKQQAVWLPSITDCHECRGRLLENGEQCAVCGNPLWKYEWLTAAD